MGNRIKGTLPFESDPGSNTIFYQTSSGTWTPVTIGSGVSFSNGVLIGSGGSILDGDLQQLANATGTNVLYYKEGDNSWKPLITDTVPPKIGNGTNGPSGYLLVRGLYDVTLGRYLIVDNHELQYVTAGGTIVENLVLDINNGGTNATTVTGARSNLGLVIGTDVQAYDSDLAALAVLGGTHDVYYRSGVGAWAPVIFNSGISFVDNKVFASGSATLLTIPVGNLVGTIDVSQGGTSATSAAEALTNLGAQPLDSDLTSLSNTNLTDKIYYRSGVGAWSPVTIGANLGFSAGTLSGLGGGLTSVVPIQSGGTNATTALTARDNLGLEINVDILGYDPDLSGIAAFTGINQLVYRQSNGVWPGINLVSGLYLNSGNNNLGITGLNLSNSNIVGVLPISKGGTNAISVVEAQTNLFLVPGTDIQVYDDDLTSLASANLTNTIYYRSGVSTWSPVTIGRNLGFSNGILSGSGGSAGGIASTVPIESGGTGAITAAGARDNLGLEIGVDIIGYDSDLASLANKIETNALFYRSGVGAWSPVSFFSGVRFDNGKLFASGTASLLVLPVGNLAGTIAISQGGTSATSASEALSNLGAQPLDNDLTSLAGASSTNSIYYRSATDTWSPVTIGRNLGFSNGILSGSGAPLGMPGGTIIPISSGGTAGTTELAARINLGLDIGTDIQGYDADLQSLANANLTNFIYYRSGAGTWSPVTVGRNLGFSNGILSGSGSAGGGGIPGVIPIESGGTGATTDSLARDNLGLTIGSDVQAYDTDLAGLAAFGGSNQLVYRQSDGIWLGVNLVSGLSLNVGNNNLGVTGLNLGNSNIVGVLPVSKGGTNATSVVEAQTNLFLVPGTDIQVYDDDLTSLANANQTNRIYYRSGTSAWSPVTIGANLGFSAGILSGSGIVGGGSIPIPLPVASGGTAGSNALQARINLGLDIGQDVQAQSADLQSLSDATGLYKIYYRAATDTWKPVFTNTVLPQVSNGGVGPSGYLIVRSLYDTTLAQYLNVDNHELFYTSADGTFISNLLLGIEFGGTNATTASAALSNLGGQPLDTDLTSLSNANQTNRIYYRSGVGEWHPVTIGQHLGFNNGILSGSGTFVGGGSIPIPLPIASGGTNATTASDARTSLGLAIGTNVQAWDTDLDGIRVFGGTNQMVYRQSEGFWLAVTTLSGIRFDNGVLFCSGTASHLSIPVSNIAGTVDITQGGTSATSAAEALTNLGAQPVDTDLTSLSNANQTSKIYFRSGAGNWHPVSPTSGLYLNPSNGILGISGINLNGSNLLSTLPITKGGTSSNSAANARINLGLDIGTDVQAHDVDLDGIRVLSVTNQMIYRQSEGVWLGVNTVSGLHLQGSNGNLGIKDISIAGGVLPVAKGGTAGTSIAEAQTNLNLVPGTNIQAYDGDLASLAAASSTNAIYYRSATSTWSPVTIGSNLTFSAGTLSASAGGGGGGLYSGGFAMVPVPPFVTVFTGVDLVQFTVPPPMNGRNINWVGAYSNVAGVGGSNTTVQITRTRSGSKVNVLSTALTIDNSEKSSSSAATPAVINASNDDLTTYDVIGLDITAVSNTPATGLTVTIGVGA